MFNSRDDRYENNVEPQNGGVTSYGVSYSNDISRTRFINNNDRYMLSSILTRIAVDVSDVEYNHVVLDDNNKYKDDIASSLNRCLNVEANIDQTAQAFRQDIVTKLFDEGVCAIVPTRTDKDPLLTDGYDVKELRVGSIVDWYPEHVRVKLWNGEKGDYSELVLPKRIVAIVQNPFYSVMNEQSSTLKRLNNKFRAMDVVDNQISSGKLNMIIQLPYATRGETRQKHAQSRVENIEAQLRSSKHGIAFLDSAESFTTIPNGIENNLLAEVESFTQLLYTELGVTAEVLNGTASEQEMLNYNNRIVKPIVNAVAQAMTRTFLSKKAITQKQAITYYQDPFALVPLGNIAKIAETFSRNAILSPNELRALVGMKPVVDSAADELRNRNMPVEDQVELQTENPPTVEGQNEI